MPGLRVENMRNFNGTTSNLILCPVLAVNLTPQHKSRYSVNWTYVQMQFVDVFLKYIIQYVCMIGAADHEGAMYPLYWVYDIY